ncbi:hypothetical protein [Bacillus sp. EAC]|uniref:hypothetical protein n=1 Tax=Bacillus sp. EAC TaxID=1978338 RepID=UPI000B44ADF3|nr:hypothetical protein [Bacillus sp. EAC]
MKPKLILVEGLPGFGKSTTATLLNEILCEMNLENELFLEGDLNHPADFDCVAYISKVELNQLLSEHILDFDFFKYVTEDRAGYFIPYQLIKNELGAKFPDKLLNIISKKDIYDLPFNQNQFHIENKWKKFASNSQHNDKVIIFECCFIQNPITVGMIKYNISKDQVLKYIKSLENAVKKLDPLLIYINQDDLELSFNKAIKERSKEWLDGFIDYYSTQEFGQANNLSGLNGTFKILQERKAFEDEIIKELSIKKEIVNNTTYDLINYKSNLKNILKKYFVQNV